MNGDKVLQAMLSFDTEEFDLPREHGAEITLERAVEVSAAGMARILDVLQHHGAKATFFCTVNFAEHAPQIMRRIIDEGHEVASHGIDHWQPEAAHVAESKRRLEELCGTTVNGYRQPRMMPVAHDEVARAGYTYNSSLHPTFIIGRYMHLNVPRTPFQQHGVLQIPVSVSPWLRLPVFWLACHHYPQWLYRWLCRWTLRHDGQFIIYFHPWEFVNLGEHPEWRVPWLIRRNSGEAMVNRLNRLVETLKGEGATFVTFSQFVAQR